MGAVFERIFEQDLNEQIKIQHDVNTMFTGDNDSNVIGVKLFKDGTAYNPSGSVSCNVIRSDGVTVSSIGTIVGNIVKATLPSNSISVPGPIGIYIKVADENTVTTVLSAICVVQASSTNAIVLPDEIISDIDALIEQINSAVESIPADYTSLLAAIAPQYATNIMYAAGMVVWYNNELYRILSRRAGAWDDSNAEKIVIGSELANIRGQIAEVFNGSGIYRDYYKNEIVTYGGNLYRIKNGYSGEWNAQNAERTNLGSEIYSLRQQVDPNGNILSRVSSIENNNKYFQTYGNNIFTMFKNGVFVCGDGFSSGYIKTSQAAGSGAIHPDIASWPYFLAKRSGIVPYNSNGYIYIKSPNVDIKTWLIINSGGGVLPLENPQLIICAFGNYDCINDPGSGAGTNIGGATDFENETDTFVGNYHKALAKVTQKYPNAKVVICSLFPGITNDEDKMADYNYALRMIVAGTTYHYLSISNYFPGWAGSEISNDPYLNSAFWTIDLQEGYGYPTIVGHWCLASAMDRLLSRMISRDSHGWRDVYLG